jgi:hypothetical protein
MQNFHFKHSNPPDFNMLAKFAYMWESRDLVEMSVEVPPTSYGKKVSDLPVVSHPLNPTTFSQSSG